MKWKFSTYNTFVGDSKPGDLCWLIEAVTVFDEGHRKHPLPKNITMVVREDEYFMLIEPQTVFRENNVAKIFHPRMGVGYISCLARIRILHNTEYME